MSISSKVHNTFKFNSYKLILWFLLSTLILLLLKMCRWRQANTPTHQIAIVRVDNIGDYILFRDFLSRMIHSREYSLYHFTLIGNIVWRELFNCLDTNHNIQCIWIDHERYAHSFLYKMRVFKLLALNKYDLAINSTYSRSFSRDDDLIRIISSKKKVGSIGDSSNISPRIKWLSNLYYTELTTHDPTDMFEFYRNQEFFSKFLPKHEIPNRPRIDSSKFMSDTRLPDTFILIFLGGSSIFKQWHHKYYAEVIKKLLQKYSYEIVLSGGTKEANDSDKIVSIVNDIRVWNYCGKTTLCELTYIISKCSLLISNDSCAPHIAATLDKKVLTITSPDHGKRFVPWPYELNSSYTAVYPKSGSGFKSKVINLSQMKKNREVKNIDSISPEQVLAASDRILTA